MSKLEFTGRPTNKFKLKKTSFTELNRYMKELAKAANKRIKEVEKANLRNYSPTYTRKYNSMLYGNTIKNIGTKSGRFSTRTGSRSNIIERITAMEQFLQNPFTTVEKSQKYLDELKERVDIQDDDLLKKMFDVYRELGFDDFKTDSERIIQIFSEMTNKGVDLNLLRDFFINNSFKDQKHEVDILEDIWHTSQIYGAVERLTPDDSVIQAIKVRERRGI